MAKGLFQLQFPVLTEAKAKTIKNTFTIEEGITAKGLLLESCSTKIV
jgi:hypothetical protein